MHESAVSGKTDDTAAALQLSYVEERIRVQQWFSPSLQMNRYLGRELGEDATEKVSVHIPFLPDIAVRRFQTGDTIQVAATGGLNLDGVQFA